MLLKYVDSFHNYLKSYIKDMIDRLYKIFYIDNI